MDSTEARLKDAIGDQEEQVTLARYELEEAEEELRDLNKQLEQLGL